MPTRCLLYKLSRKPFKPLLMTTRPHGVFEYLYEGKGNTVDNPMHVVTD